MYMYFVSIFRSIPALCIHRKDWNTVYPFLSLTEEKEMAELKSKRSYIAGFTNGEIENRAELYDIFLNGISYGLLTMFLLQIFVFLVQILNIIY